MLLHLHVEFLGICVDVRGGYPEDALGQGESSCDYHGFGLEVQGHTVRNEPAEREVDRKATGNLEVV